MENPFLIQLAELERIKGTLRSYDLEVVVSAIEIASRYSGQSQPTTVLSTDHSFFAPKFSIWCQMMCIPQSDRFSFISYDRAVQRIKDMRILISASNELRKQILKGSMSEIKPPFIPFVTKDIEDKKKVSLDTDISITSSTHVIELIIGDKEVDRFQISANHKQTLAIFSNSPAKYNHYPSIYLFDNNLVHARFFDILTLVFSSVS